MTATLLRTYGAIAISIFVCLIFLSALVLVVWSKDMASQQLLIGAIVGYTAAVVQYYVGSSASSAQKDEKERPPHA